MSKNTLHDGTKVEPELIVCPEWSNLAYSNDPADEVLYVLPVESVLTGLRVERMGDTVLSVSWVDAEGTVHYLRWVENAAGDTVLRLTISGESVTHDRYETEDLVVDLTIPSLGGYALNDPIDQIIRHGVCLDFSDSTWAAHFAQKEELGS